MLNSEKNPFLDSDSDSESDSEVSSIDSSDSFEVISNFDIEEKDSEGSGDSEDTPEDIADKPEINRNLTISGLAAENRVLKRTLNGVLGLQKDGTIEIFTPRCSEQRKAAISGEWRLMDSGEDSEDSEEFKNTLRCFKFQGDNLITYQKYQGVENYSLSDERKYIRNGKLHVMDNNTNVRVYEKLKHKELSIDKDINGTWKVTSIENFEKFKKFRNLRKDQEFLWQYGHAYFKLEDGQLIRGTLINGHQKDFTTVTLNVPIEEGSTSKVTFLDGDKLITVCKWSGSGLEKWRIERYFKGGKLHVVHCYPSGMVCSRVLERV